MISETHIKEILEKPVLAAGVKKYNRIMARFCQTDISVDIEFQALFRDFYQMRRFYSREGNEPSGRVCTGIWRMPVGSDTP